MKLTLEIAIGVLLGGLAWDGVHHPQLLYTISKPPSVPQVQNTQPATPKAQTRPFVYSDPANAPPTPTTDKPAYTINEATGRWLGGPQSTLTLPTRAGTEATTGYTPAS
jgi:hypothetical protein